MTNALSLEVRGLTVSINGTELLHELDLSVQAGESVGFIGGSGSGKTLTALAIAGLLPEHAVVEGSIRLDGRELVGLPEKELALIRGDLIGVVFQEPKTALNPLRKLGKQITEALTTRYDLSRRERRDAALRLASAAGLSDPERIVDSYPHEVSGGQRQRAAIAAAISARPGLLFADEPTTALDVTVQQGVLELFQRITAENESTLVFITHDLAVLSSVADRLYVFDEGAIIETGSTRDIIADPQHPVTLRLLEAARNGDDALKRYEAM
ncbi:ABC transporter ATP-binding protein [Leucobacter sp. UCMA 4100]|uniref:ATP-binding cassette domain-containing protein n=1 Tax=Leucobacter sp. UCMA 4100 TaxID=2810534 RepID=UPI0022EADBB1|nr:ABC transporter ATP-binding protein [Leucobacter sp. UCMA 4100]MDA3146087.1 ABC transporter ATP-binding protein [Leucobacter sp. UCMA 4100]